MSSDQTKTHTDSIVEEKAGKVTTSIKPIRSPDLKPTVPGSTVQQSPKPPVSSATTEKKPVSPGEGGSQPVVTTLKPTISRSPVLKPTVPSTSLQQSLPPPVSSTTTTEKKPFSPGEGGTQPVVTTTFKPSASQSPVLKPTVPSTSARQSPPPLQQSQWQPPSSTTKTPATEVPQIKPQAQATTISTPSNVSGPSGLASQKQIVSLSGDCLACHPFDDVDKLAEIYRREGEYWAKKGWERQFKEWAAKLDSAEKAVTDAQQAQGAAYAKAHDANYEKGSGNVQKKFDASTQEGKNGLKAAQDTVADHETKKSATEAKKVVLVNLKAEREKFTASYIAEAYTQLGARAFVPRDRARLVFMMVTMSIMFDDEDKVSQGADSDKRTAAFTLETGKEFCHGYVNLFCAWYNYQLPKELKEAFPVVGRSRPYQDITGNYNEDLLITHAWIGVPGVENPGPDNTPSVKLMDPAWGFNKENRLKPHVHWFWLNNEYFGYRHFPVGISEDPAKEAVDQRPELQLQLQCISSPMEYGVWQKLWRPQTAEIITTIKSPDNILRESIELKKVGDKVIVSFTQECSHIVRPMYFTTMWYGQAGGPERNVNEQTIFGAPFVPHGNGLYVSEIPFAEMQKFKEWPKLELMINYSSDGAQGYGWDKTTLWDVAKKGGWRTTIIWTFEWPGRL